MSAFEGENAFISPCRRGVEKELQKEMKNPEHEISERLFPEHNLDRSN